MESEGLRSVFFPAQGRHDLGQQIIVAESDGIVRKKRPNKPNSLPRNKKFGMKVLNQQPFEQNSLTKQTGIVNTSFVTRKKHSNYQKV